MACITEGSTLSARLRSPPVSVRAGLQGCVAEGRAVADGDDLVRSPRPEKRTGRLQQGSWHVSGTANPLHYDLPFLRSYRNRLAAASYSNLCRWSPCWRGPVDQDMRALLDHLVGSDQQRSGMVRPSALAVLRFKTACPQAAPRSKAESLTTARAPELPGIGEDRIMEVAVWCLWSASPPGSPAAGVVRRTVQRGCIRRTVICA